MSDARSQPFFIADSRGLDFLNSIATPGDTPVEYIGSGADLLAWLQDAGMAPAEVRKALLRDAVSGELDGVAAQARALREWFRDFVNRHMGRPLAAEALAELEPLNRVLARDEEFGQITVHQAGPDDAEAGEDAAPALRWMWRRRWRSAESLLSPIARSMADLICDEDFSLVKACEGPTCTLVFVDRTRGHGRRWCSMAVCGNRAKQAAHRERVARRAAG